MQINIIVNLEYEAIHQWKNCDIPEVSFLKHPHRHIFKIQCKKEVKHTDRDIEIIMLKRKILKYLDKFNNDFSTMSCEDIAGLLLYEFELNYCMVLEDGENGAEVCL